MILNSKLPPIAITRDVSSAIEECELTHLPRTRIDYALAVRQHEAYERCLIDLGCGVERLAATDDMPDSVFVEDIAVVFDELAVITRPGAASRRAETEALVRALERHRPLRCIQAPATLDGGDVLRVDRDVYVGRSARTNAAGIEQMRRILEPLNYRVQGVDVTGCLHLKSAVTAIGERELLINRAWTDASAFDRFSLIDIDPSEPFAANALRIGETIVYSAAFEQTKRRLVDRGFHVVTVDVSETAKAEGGVTCCSLVFQPADRVR
jgi:dimethylargininase